MFIQLACFSCVAWFFFLISYSVGRLVSECVWLEMYSVDAIVIHIEEKYTHRVYGFIFGTV